MDARENQNLAQIFIHRLEKMAFSVVVAKLPYRRRWTLPLCFCCGRHTVLRNSTKNFVLFAFKAKNQDFFF